MSGDHDSHHETPIGSSPWKGNDVTDLPTDPIRDEHRELIPHLLHVEEASVQVTGWDLSQAQRSLPRIVGFLRDDLVPHARAEEELLYPAVDRLQGAATTATMIVDHIVIGELIEKLATDVEEALADWDNQQLVAGLSRELAAVAAIVGLHFRKEEEVLLPILDAGLTIEEGHELFGQMGHTDHAH